MPPILPCRNNDFCHGYTDSYGGLCYECARRARKTSWRWLSNCVAWSLAWPLYILWAIHERSIRRKIEKPIRCDGGEGMGK